VKCLVQYHPDDPVLVHDALEEQLRFTQQGTPQVVVEIRKLERVRDLGLEVPEVEPLPRKIRHQRL